MEILDTVIWAAKINVTVSILNLLNAGVLIYCAILGIRTARLNRKMTDTLVTLQRPDRHPTGTRPLAGSGERSELEPDQRPK